MALGTEMKLLVEDILASRDSRGKTLNDIKKDTRHIIGDARNMLKDFAKEDEERAGEVKKIADDVKAFLKSSAKDRKHDFDAVMKTVDASLENVRKDSKHYRQAGKAIVKDAKVLLSRIAGDNKEQAKELREGLKKEEHHRRTNFKSMMADIQEDLKDVKQDVSKARKDAKDMVSRYYHSRMSAQKHWTSLSAGRKKAKKHKSEE